MKNNIIYNIESKKLLKSGVDQLANAVKVTLGPSGLNVIIGTDPANPIITKDGVSVAKEVWLENPFENIGAQLMKQVAISTNNKVGDGTTTATVLAQAILQEGFKRINDDAASVVSVVSALKDELPAIVQKLKDMSVPISTTKDIKNVALISTNGDEELSTLIAECYDKVRDNIIFEHSQSSNTYKEIVSGMRFQSTYINTHFITQPDTNSVSYDKGLIFIYNGKVDSIKKFMPVLMKAEKEKLPLIFIAESFDDNSIATLVNNRVKGFLHSTAIQSPGFGFGRQKTLTDIAIYTGAEICDGTTNVSTVKLGKFDSAYIDENYVTLKGMYGDKVEIEGRVKELEMSKKDKNTYEVSKINERIAKFQNGIGVIYIGANSPVELKEREDRLEDAINAVKAATEEGIVPGGGVALMEIALSYPNSIYGYVLNAPFRQILINQGDTALEYDIDSPGIFMEKGIIDPVKVTRVALENAVSVASTILTTECIVL